MNAPTVPPRRGRTMLLGGLALVLAAGVVLWEKHTRFVAAAPARRTAPATRQQVNETARLREFARSVVGRAVLLQPGEALPPHWLNHEDGREEDEFRRSPAEVVSPAMLFEGALRDAAAERKLSVEQARASLRDFAAQGRAGTAVEFLDDALASFAEQDYAGAERHALAAAAQCEPASSSEGDALLQVIADSGALRETASRQRAALQLAGDAQMMQSKFWEAETSYRAAVRLVSKTDAAPWIEAQWRVALANGERGHFNVSLALWKEIAAVCSAKRGPNDPSTLAAQSWMAWEMEQLPDHTEAVALEYEIMARRLKSVGPDGLDVARSLTALGHNAAAFSLPRELEALGIREKQLGTEHPETLRSMRRAIREYRSYGERMARKAIAASERIFGPEHLEVAEDLQTLANLLEPEDDGPEIEALHRRALAIRERHLPGDDSLVIAERGELENVLEKIGKPPELTRLLRRRIAEAERQFGPEHVEVVRGLSLLGRYQSGTEPAAQSQQLETLRRVLKLCDVLLGDAPEEVADPQVRLTLLRAQRAAIPRISELIEPEVAAAEHLRYRYTEATLRLLKTKVEMAERAHGSEHPDVAEYLEAYAKFVGRWKKPADALPHWRRVFEIRLKAFGPEERTVIQPLRAFYSAQETPAGFREAEAVARRMLALQEKLPNVDPQPLAERCYELAALLHDQGQSEEIEPLLRRAAEGAHGPETEARESWRSIALGTLAGVLREAGRGAEAVPLYQEAIPMDEASDDSYRQAAAADKSVALSAVLGQLGRFPEAEAQLEKALKFLANRDSWGDPSGVLEARATKGLLYLQQGRSQEARAILAVEVDWMRQINKQRDELMKSAAGREDPTEPWQYTGDGDGYGQNTLPWSETGPTQLERFEKYLAEADAAVGKLRR